MVSSRATQVCCGLFGDAEELAEVTSWELGDGATIRFWEEVWCDSISLQDRFPCLVSTATRREGVTDDYWSQEECKWVLRLRRRLQDWEAPQLEECCALLQRKSVVNGVLDRALWRPHPHKSYSTKLAYNWWRALWIPGADVGCPFGCREVESVDHLFGACQVAHKLWSHFTVLEPSLAEVEDVEGLWRAGSRLVARHDKSRKGQVLRSIVPACAWALWLSRNEVVFKGSRFYFENLWLFASQLISEWGVYLVGATTVRFEGDHLVLEE
ncbi:hypothetical protein QJS10_CPB12g00564 [Acorus calamus]|uniref:Reverse transcriptase zinc-binding domain-containing protein n=1 Tax=Acorus calamus TaxID=4465 RepID=A0AAV9DPS7_ACOCL|nr:hypothetical protein QJS10_CPB12g00564 [Acorus calamus]